MASKRAKVSTLLVAVAMGAGVAVRMNQKPTDKMMGRTSTSLRQALPTGGGDVVLPRVLSAAGHPDASAPWLNPPFDLKAFAEARTKLLQERARRASEGAAAARVAPEADADNQRPQK